MSKQSTKKVFFDTLSIATMVGEALKQDLEVAKTAVGYPEYLEHYREIQNVSTCKKVEVEKDAQRLQDEAFDSFIQRNRSLGVVNATLSRGGIDDSSIIGYVLRRARHLVRWALTDISAEEIYDACRHSNGVTQGVPFMDTSLNRKSLFPWTATKGITSTLTDYFAYDPLYARACSSYTLQMAVLGPEISFKITEGSRATTVPKSVDKRRMIAVEPTGNMYIQQGLMHVMYKRLEKIGLDLATLPERHRDLAYWSSVSGHLATVDFSNASDSVATQLVKYLVPPRWWAWLRAARSPVMSVNGQDVRLNCYATMGNATTFPVESLVFWSLAVASVMFDHRQKHYGVRPWRITSLLSTPEERSCVSVFGDDVILPRQNYGTFQYVSSCLGLSVNTEKSFYGEGRGFRESCGGDFFHGRRFRPFMIKGPTTSSKIGLEAWLYVMANGLLKTLRSSVGGVGYIYEKQVFEVIFNLFRQCTPLVKVVPEEFPEDSGLKGLEGLRLARCYLAGDKISPIGITDQGWVTFKYLRFRYKKQNEVFEHLRYAVWVKNHTVKPKPFRWSDFLATSELLNQSPHRKKGEYVVSRATATSL